MEYRIETKPAFAVAGKQIRVKMAADEHLRVIPAFWDECIAGGICNRLKELSKSGSVLRDVLLGVCADFAADMSEFTYMVAGETAEAGAPADLALRTIPASTWAVFEARGEMPEAIQSLWQRITQEFLPTAPYNHGDGPELEVYPGGDVSAPDYVFEVWVPVVTK